MPFLVVMPYRRTAPLKDPQLWGAHVSSDGGVWVWGQVGFASESDPTPANDLMVRAWDGAAWATDDRTNYVWPAGATPPGTFYAIQMMSLFALPSGEAFSSPDSYRGNLTFPPTNNVAWWDGATWTDQLAAGGCYLVGTSASDLYALREFPFDGDDQSVNWHHWNGSSWGSLQSDLLTNISGNHFFGGKAGGFNYTAGGWGKLADICPDGVIFYAGAQLDAPQHKVLARVDPGVSADLVLDAGSGYFHAVWCAANDAIYTIIEVTGTSRGLYLWDRSGSPSWVLQSDASWGCGICIHGVSVSDWWMGRNLDISQWDGATYTDYSLPDPHPGVSSGPEVRGIWAAASNDVWAVGRLYNTTTNHYEAPVWHWDGSSWGVQHVFTS